MPKNIIFKLQLYKILAKFDARQRITAELHYYFCPRCLALSYTTVTILQLFQF